MRSSNLSFHPTIRYLGQCPQAAHPHTYVTVLSWRHLNEDMNASCGRRAAELVPDGRKGNEKDCPLRVSRFSCHASVVLNLSYGRSSAGFHGKMSAAARSFCRSTVGSPARIFFREFKTRRCIHAENIAHRLVGVVNDEAPVHLRW